MAKRSPGQLSLFASEKTGYGDPVVLDDIDVMPGGLPGVAPARCLDDDGPDEGGKKSRVVLMVTPGEREVLRRVVESTGYPNARVAIVDALREFQAQVDSSVAGIGTYGNLVPLAGRLLAQSQAMGLAVQRLERLLAAYQRSFQVFTILHDSKFVRKDAGE
jgi:hypothetical protein